MAKKRSFTEALRLYSIRNGTAETYERRTLGKPEDTAFFAFAEVLEIDPYYLQALERLATERLKQHVGRDFGFPGTVAGYSGMGSIMGENPIDVPIPHGNLESDSTAANFNHGTSAYCYEVACDIFREFSFTGWSANKDSQIGFSMFSKDTEDRLLLVERGLKNLRLTNPLIQKLLACPNVSDAHQMVLEDPEFGDLCVFVMLAIERRQPWRVGKKVRESTIKNPTVHEVERISRYASSMKLSSFFGPARRRAPQGADFSYSGPLACLTAGYMDPAYTFYDMTLKQKDPGAIRAKVQARLNRWYAEYLAKDESTFAGRLAKAGKPFKVTMYAGDVVACEKEVPQEVSVALLKRHDELVGPYGWGRLTANVPCLVFVGDRLKPLIVGDPAKGSYTEFSENRRGTQSGEWAVVTKNQVGVSSTFREIFNKVWPETDWLPSALEDNDRVMHLSKTDDNLVITIDSDAHKLLEGEHFDGIMPIELERETNEKGEVCGTFLAMLYHVTYSKEGAPLVHVQKELGTYISNCMPGEGGITPEISKEAPEEIRWHKSSNRVSSRNAGFGFILRAIFYRQWNENTEALHMTWMQWLRDEFNREWYDCWPIAGDDINELRVMITKMLESVENNSNYYEVKPALASALKPWIKENPDFLYKGWIPMDVEDLDQDELEEAFMYISPEQFSDWTDGALPIGSKVAKQPEWAALHHVGQMKDALEFGLYLCSEADKGIRSTNPKRYRSTMAPSGWYRRARLTVSKYIDRTYKVADQASGDGTRPSTRT